MTTLVPRFQPLARRVAAWAVVVSACVMVFTMYQHPEVLISLADQLWACF